MRGCRLILLVVVLVACAVAAAPAAAADRAGSGTTESGTFTYRGSSYPYLLHTPRKVRGRRAIPLVVAIHGCQTTAKQEMELSRFNDLADEEGFAVLYPDGDAIGKQQPGPLRDCWKFFDPTAYFRGNSDSAAIAEMTRHVMASRVRVDPERVYAIGVSAGGLMTSALAATDSDLFAAVGIVVSAGYADGTCFTNGVGTPVVASAALAYAQMEERARVVPVIGIGGDADQAFPATCTVKAVEQGLRTNNLVLSGGSSQEAPLSLTPSSSQTAQVAAAGGRSYTVSSFRDPDGCLVAERWIIHGMAHTWPGGDPDYGGYVDPRAPDGAPALWDFLQRYRRSGTDLPCAEF